MPTRDHPPAGAPCWIDLMTTDTARSRDFYRQVFGWEAGEPAEQYGGYFTFTRNGVQVAGCMASQPGESTPTIWSIYLASDDAAKTLDAATGHGGNVQVAAMTVGDLGSMAYLADPTGASVGVWQPGKHQGFGVYGEPGAPAWFELHTSDYHAAVNFYRDVFGLETEVAGDTPDFRYTILRKGDEQVAGIMDATAFLPEGQPARWSVYFGSDDTDASLAKVTAAGGAVVQAAEDTPYGRLATVADPAGAQFKLAGPSAAAAGQTAS
jgi:uncharacterized protein